MTMQAPLVSVVILNYRSGKVALKCVREMLKQTLIDQMEIVVVDNHSQDDSIGFLRGQLQHEERVRIVETPQNSGFGAGYNTGIRYARGTYILINNPAKILQQNGVELLVQKIQQDNSIGIISPKLSYADGTSRFSARTFPHPLDVIAKRTFLERLFPKRVQRYLQCDRSPDEERNTDWVAGGCLLMQKYFFDSLGGFDDDFFLFFEDIDLCRRCKEAGKAVHYYPRVQALDRKSRLSEMSAFAMLRTKIGRAHLASGIRYFWKWRHVG